MNTRIWRNVVGAWPSRRSGGRFARPTPLDLRSKAAAQLQHDVEVHHIDYIEAHGHPGPESRPAADQRNLRDVKSVSARAEHPVSCPLLPLNRAAQAANEPPPRNERLRESGLTGRCLRVSCCTAKTTTACVVALYFQPVYPRRIIASSASPPVTVNLEFLNKTTRFGIFRGLVIRSHRPVAS